MQPDQQGGDAQRRRGQVCGSPPHRRVGSLVGSQVTPYKKVRRVEFLDAVPRAATGKILRRELRDRERSSSPS
jgi:acyl-coenzyme A synthetase/AMP-(fatty) acid ligase